MPPTPVPPQQPSAQERPVTVLEADDDIRRALQAIRPGPPVPAPPAQPLQPPGSRPYRPTLRPPIAVLTVLDDGKTDGEVIRIRADRFVIGRTEGDFLVPHDELISGRHVEVTRQSFGGAFRWVVTDLQSRNGLFVRVSRTALADRAEFLVGQGRYRFEVPSAPAPDTVDYLPPEAALASTRPWGAAATPRHPILIELLVGGAGARVPLVRPEYWIGTDPDCPICRAGDPFTEPRHVRLSRDAHGAWYAQNTKSPNGLWLKVPQITVEGGCLFQIGEQRFRLKVEG